MNLLPVKDILETPFFIKNYHTGRWQIGLSISKPNAQFEQKHLISELAKFIANNAKKSDFWFFQVDKNSNNKKNALLADKIVTEAKKYTKEQITIISLPATYHPQLFFSAVKLMHGFVSMHMHSSLFAYRLKVPFVGISSDADNIKFLKAIGIEPLRIKSLRESTISKRLL